MFPSAVVRYQPRSSPRVNRALSIRFELLRLGQESQHSHPHFVCLTCGDVACLPGVTVTIKQTPAAKLATNLSHVDEVLLKGVCGRCQ